MRKNTVLAAFLAALVGLELVREVVALRALGFDFGRFASWIKED